MLFCPIFMVVYSRTEQGGCAMEMTSSTLMQSQLFGSLVDQIFKCLFEKATAPLSMKCDIPANRFTQ
jgi:hypothetical protein